MATPWSLHKVNHCVDFCYGRESILFELYISETIQHVLFVCVCFFQSTIVKSLHIVCVVVAVSFPLLYGIHSTVDRPWNCFQFEVFMNTAIMNILVHAFW